MLLSNFRNYVVLKQIMSLKLTFNGWVLILTDIYCGTRNQKVVLGKKSWLVEFSTDYTDSRASRFSRSLARLASG